MHRMARKSCSRGFITGYCALALAGCGTPVGDVPSAIHAAIMLPPDAGTVGLTVARPVPEFSLELPETKHDAARSVAAAGARDVARDPHVAMFFPVGYVLGGVIGGILGVNEGELQVATQSIAAAVRAHPIDAPLAHMILARLEAEYPERVRQLGENVPLEPGPVHGRMRQDDRHRVSWMKPSPAPHPLAGTGVDVVVGLRVTFLGFRARTDPRIHSTGDMEKINPSLALVVSADIVAVQVSDWTHLGGSTLRYESSPRKFTAWAAENAAPLRREMEAALLDLQRQIARQLSRRRADSAETKT